MTVEVDESKFGTRKYNVCRVIEGQWVFGGICRQTKDFFLVPVASRDSATLVAIIRDRIQPNTTIISDCWKAYKCLKDEAFQHLTVNHSMNFVDPITGAHTQNIESHWRVVKDQMPRYGHFLGYLAITYFKICFPNSSQRLHHFLLAAAKLITYI